MNWATPLFAIALVNSITALAGTVLIFKGNSADPFVSLVAVVILLCIAGVASSLALLLTIKDECRGR